MSSRLAGAILALTAAALVALALFATSLWTGHPTFDGKVIEAKTIFVGPTGASGCNTGGDGACQPLALKGSSAAVGYGVLATSGLLAAAAVILALMTLARSEARKTVAVAVIALGSASALAVIAMIVVGVNLEASSHVSMKFGAGIYLLGGAMVAAMVGSVLSRRPFPKLEPRPSRAAIAPGLSAPPVQHQGQQPVDVLALLQDDHLRPSSLGPEPMMGNRQTAPPTTPLPGPAGPLGAPAPLFNSAPQLRPLYDADPNVGGTGGYVPGVRPDLPARGPTPLPIAAAHAIQGLPTPPPMQVPKAPITSMGAAAVPPAPPPRTKPPSLAPPPPPPPPGAARARPGTVPPPGQISARLKASSVPPPVRPGALPRSNPPSTPTAAPSTPRTLAAAVVPPPTATPAPLLVAKQKQLPIRPETDEGELAETAPHEAGDSTDANVPIDPPPDTEEAPAARAMSETEDVETGAVAKVEPPRAASHAETNSVEKVEAEVARHSMSEIETIAREKLSASELAVGDSTSPSSEQADETAEPKIPISTAPDSLPPPTEKQATTSGPTPACPQCEAPMAWVEEHLRFYCKSCRMYF